MPEQRCELRTLKAVTVNGSGSRTPRLMGSPMSATSPTGLRRALGRVRAGRRVDLGLAGDELAPGGGHLALLCGSEWSCPTWPKCRESSWSIRDGGSTPSLTVDKQGEHCNGLTCALSPRSDSSRRPSDYESDRNPPTRPAQDHRRWSGAGAISSSAVPRCLVVAPGLPERLPTIRRWRQRTCRACLG
jgi:hypothetical protein